MGCYLHLYGDQTSREGDRYCVSWKGKEVVWKYVERIMYEENGWDHNVGEVEGK